MVETRRKKVSWRKNMFGLCVMYERKKDVRINRNLIDLLCRIFNFIDVYWFYKCKKNPKYTRGIHDELNMFCVD